MNTWFTAVVPGSTPHAVFLRKAPIKKKSSKTMCDLEAYEWVVIYLLL